MMLRYLIYTSRLLDDRGPAAVPEVVRQARANNAIRAITGALIFDGERFCQYLEGEPEVMARTFMAIDNDPRHADLRVLASGIADQRRFAHWSMAYVYAATPELLDQVGDRGIASVAETFEHVLIQCDTEA